MSLEHSIILTAAQRKIVADLFPKLADRLKLDEKNPRTISFTAKELESIRSKAEATRPHAGNGLKRNSLRHVFEALDESEGIGSIPSFERLYQFKITLLDVKPQIWRRIQVKDSALDKLHERIQTVMGWTNSHLHHFEIDGLRKPDKRCSWGFSRSRSDENLENAPSASLID